MGFVGRGLLVMLRHDVDATLGLRGALTEAL
jgi:hypothetical protein